MGPENGELVRWLIQERYARYEADSVAGREGEP